MTDATLQELLEELAKVRALDFRGYKPASLQRRLRKRIAQLNLGGYREYIEYFRDNAGEINHLLSVVLINVTEFFRDPAAWEVLRREALPQVLNRMQRGGTFRAWCAGCASGEEVYSLAMLVAEHFGPHLGEFDIKLYASDHDEEALAVARRGEYPVERLRRVPPEWQEKYFSGSGSMRRVERELRRLAIFGRSNLVSDAPISHIQLLVCRNVLIYFDIPLQHQVIDKFRYALEDGGILFLGKSESQLRDLTSFHPINTKWRIFQCMKDNGASRREDKIPQPDNLELD
ncbi:MAG TPA: protein-glutamate O-methyltransferase CheR, partial [Terriglobales bacterium]|nr:protein-glutamate O-methyltransferase CheR [Terriglobales bacterium]